VGDERLIMQAAQRQPVVVNQLNKQAHVTIKSIEPGMTINTITNGSTLYLRSRKAEEELYQLIRENEDNIPKEVSTLLSTLDAINDVNDDTVQQLQQQLVDMSRERDEQEELYKKEKEETRRWKSIACELRKKCRSLDESDDDISSVDLDQDESDRCHSTRTEDTTASTISFLSSENGMPSDLVMKNGMKELQAENDALHESLEEAMQLAKGMKEIVSYFARVHKENPPIHSGEKVRLLKEEVNESKSKLLADLCDVMEDIHILRSSSDELDDTVSM